MKEFVIIGSGFDCSLYSFNKLMNQIFLLETVKCSVGVLLDNSSAVRFIVKLSILHFIVLILGTIITIMMEVSVEIVIKCPAIKDFVS